MPIPWTLVRRATLASLRSDLDYTTATVQSLQAKLAASQAALDEERQKGAALARFGAALILDENRTYRLLQSKKLERAGLFDLGIKQEDAGVRLSLVAKGAFAKREVQARVGEEAAARG